MSEERNELNKRLELFTDGKVKTKSGREFTRLIGGFGKGKPVITTKYISDLTGYELRVVNQTIERNMKDFEENIHIIDLKKIITDSDHLLKLGYSKVAVGRSTSKFYGLSQAGFLLYLKFANGEKSVEIYKDFIEDYFRTKAENQAMKKSIEDEIKELEKNRYKISGLAVFNPIQEERVEAQKKLLNLDNRIIKMRSTIDNKNIRNSLEKQAKLTESKARYITQSEFGTRFNNKIGAKTIGKILKIVGIAKKSYKRTIPYQEFVPKYAVNIINNDKELDYDIYYKWNYNECSKYINQWLLDNDYHDEFYGITDKDELVKFIDKLYDTYVINNEEAI